MRTENLAKAAGGEHSMTEVWTIILAAASAIVLLSNAAEKIVRAFKSAKAPEVRQNEEINDLKRRLKKVEDWVETEKQQVKDIREGNRVITRGMLALLEHGINGNNIEQMQEARNGVEEYLINH